MKYKVELSPKAYKFLEKTDNKLKERIKKKLKILENNPILGKPLTGSIYFSLRIGDYRVIYRIKRGKKKIKIIFIAHRKHVYTEFDKMFLVFF